jgi:sulfatase modifying factor 1
VSGRRTAALASLAAVVAAAALAWGPSLACSAGSTPIAGPPPGQVLLFVDTDAPVPDPDPAALPALFDRVRFELREPGQTTACNGCLQDYELQAALVIDGNASVGLAFPPGETGWTVRVRLYWSPFAASDGEPDPRSSIDTIVALPVLETDGIVEQTVLLRTDDVGAGPPSSPVAALPGSPSTSLEGTWPGAQRAACSGSAHPHEVCIPGGAFWMGTTHSPYAPGTSWTGSRPVPPRLVVSSPFWLGDSEVTVAAYRAFGSAPPQSEQNPYCTFLPSGNDALPLDCVTWADARAYCESIGADLPTEAQYEYVAGGLGQNAFVWGSDPPSCDGGVWGQPFGFEPNACGDIPTGPQALPVAGRSQDALPLEAGVVYDLAGNLQEWTRDAFENVDGGCWAEAGIVTDPDCPGEPDADTRTARGGGWLWTGLSMFAVFRGSVTANSGYIVTGFRCARAVQP